MLTPADIIALLRADVAPSLGCTEPACAAIAAADAASRLTSEPVAIELAVSPQLFKNGRSVGIPRYAETGMDHAAALGALIARPELGLEVFSAIDADVARKAQALAAATHVTIDPEHPGVYAAAEVTDADGHVARTVISGAHTRVIERAVDNAPLPPSDDGPDGAPLSAERHAQLAAEVVALDLAGILALAERCDVADLAFLADGIEMNEAVAARAAEDPSPVGIGQTLADGATTGVFGRGLSDRIVLKVASGIESRLDGAPCTVMSSAGAGSKGLAVVLPITETAAEVGATAEQTLRALALGHLVNTWANGRVGKLTAMCTCGMAASTAAACGMAYLMGADAEGIGRTVRTMCGTIAGMVCDGAKPSCGMKLAVASHAAVLAAAMGASGRVIRASDGIGAETPEEAMGNVARLAREGMADADAVMLDIMANK